MVLTRREGMLTTKGEKIEHSFQLKIELRY